MCLTIKGFSNESTLVCIRCKFLQIASQLLNVYAGLFLKLNCGF